MRYFGKPVTNLLRRKQPAFSNCTRKHTFGSLRPLALFPVRENSSPV
jgi:hypothetical protein